MLWSCASATTTQHFDRGIKEISKTDKALFDWLRHIPPKHWSMSHFTGRFKCDVFRQFVMHLLCFHLLMY
ncbi:hypothetical protein HanPSC8_Chr02g0058741 [Helianthus annuus]|nr:hypothetical protein HanPSC8_Chr02g0058741 [Helianthus annuus]